MGASRIYHVIGTGNERNGKSLLYPAMSHLDMAQQAEKARRNNDTIVGWYSQTKTGEKMLQHTVKIKTVICPKCSGFGCSICNVSGITTRRWLSGFQPWQLKPEVQP